MSSKQNTHGDVWIAGAVAAFTIDLLVYPLDTLKTRFQSQNYSKLYVDPKTGAVNRALLTRGLYQGVGSVILATLPSSGAFFTTYEAAKFSFARANSSFHSTTALSLPQPIVHAAASSTAELVSCAILTPAEVIKQNAQMVMTTENSPSTSRHTPTPSTLQSSQPSSAPSRPKENATFQTLRRFRSNPLALWRGYATLAARNLPHTALHFPLFEHLRSSARAALLTRRQRDHHNNSSSSGSGIHGPGGAPRSTEPRLTFAENTAITSASAGLAGAVAATITTPIDVVKTRVMLSAADFSSTPPSSSSSTTTTSSSPSTPTRTRHQPKTATQIALDIFRRDGVRGLWRGGALRAVWTLFGSGTYLGVYEGVRTWLALRRGSALEEMDT